jgi:ankyrin repeat protein
MTDDSRTRAEEIVARFLECVGTGQTEDVRAMLAAVPRLVNTVGPHPFWGGRPQPLHVAIETKRRDLFDLLLDAGADVNGVNDAYDHWSPLMIAIDHDDLAMRDELLRRGARVGLLEALMLADDRRVEEFLASGTLPDIRPNGGSLLAFARTRFAADRLIELGAPTDIADRWGSTPIDAISRLGTKGAPLVRHLAARGVPAAAKEYARLGDRETLARMIAADPAVASSDSVLMGAVDFRHHALVSWLLENGANPNARSDAQSRHTALHSAAWNGDLEMVKLLLAAGADPAIRDAQYNATARGWAETSIEISNNPDCAAVAEYLA